MQAGNNEMVCWFAKLKHVISWSISKRIANSKSECEDEHFARKNNVIIGVPGARQVRGASATFQAVAET